MREISLDCDLKNEHTENSNNTIRLNKYLAMCGLGSRRKVEQLIANGRVKVDGKIAPGPWILVNDRSAVEVDERPIVPLKHIYVVMNKPCGCVCAVTDARYKTVLDLLPKKIREHHPFPVGRLDKNSSGLLILTNDGDFANDLIHPRNKIVKTYEVMLNKSISANDLAEWRKGVWLDDKIVTPKSVKVIDERRCEVEVYEGLKREIRRMAETLGYKVVELKRTKIGNLKLASLKVGAFLTFSKEELLRMICSGGVI